MSCSTTVQPGIVQHSPIPDDVPLPITANRDDPYRRAIWGRTEVQRPGGQVIVLHSKLEHYDLRLWLYTTEELTFQPYMAIAPHAHAAQLVISRPPPLGKHEAEIVYLSSEVDVELILDETVDTCRFSISSSEPQIDLGLVKAKRLKGTGQLAFDVPIDVQQGVSPDLLPRAAYLPDLVQDAEYSDPLPPGYVLRTRPSPGLLAPGIALLASGYTTSLILAGAYRFSDGGQLYAIPIAGPALYIPKAWHQLQSYYDCSPGEVCEGSMGDLVLPIFLTLTTVGLTAIQTAGLSLTIASLVKRDPYWTRQTGSQPSVHSRASKLWVTGVPWLAPGTAGAAVIGQF